MIFTHQVETPCTTISALTDQGVVYSQLSQGTNTDLDILHFLVELQKALKTQHEANYQEYISKLVVVMDNASVH